MAKQEYIEIVTPLGKARYPKLDKQDTYEGKEVGYKIGIILEDEALEKVRAQIDAAVKTLLPNAGKKGPKFTPLREDKDGNEYLEFKSYKKTPLFGPKNNKLPEGTAEKLGGGSIIRIKGSMTASNGGVVGYLNGIQIAKLVERGTGGFEELDEGSYEEFASEGFDEVEGDGGLDI